VSKDSLFYKKNTLNIAGKILSLESPLVMGIINLTEDSFYTHSRVSKEKALLERAERMLQEGADMLDLGAFSSRPGAAEIAADEQWQRLNPAITAIAQHFPHCIISVDTDQAMLARKCIDAGAHLINDISGGADPNMFATVAELQVPYVLMHMRGTPANMQSMTQYEDILKEMMQYFSERLAQLQALGHHDIIIDPGIGFAKSLEQNYEILKNLRYFEILERPLLIGISRKSLIWKKLSITADEALNGSTALHMHSLLQGASILRVHDVREAKETIMLYNELN
jgi:dihydropteroate synthase